MTLRKGDTAYIIDQQGATFAVGTPDDAHVVLADERERGAVRLELFTITVPRDGMTWDEIAEHGCHVGPQEGTVIVKTPDDEADL